MRDNRQKRKVVSGELDEDSESLEPEKGQLLVTECEMRVWVKEVVEIYDYIMVIM